MLIFFGWSKGSRVAAPSTAATCTHDHTQLGCFYPEQLPQLTHMPMPAYPVLVCNSCGTAFELCSEFGGYHNLA